MQFPLRLSVLAVILAAAGCAPEVVPSSGPRPPLSPADVKMYQKEPSRYEDLGQISLLITPEYHWDKNGDAKPAFAKMREKAAALGANGILLKGDAGPGGLSVGAGDGKAYYLVPVKANPKTAIGEAIFVIKE